MSTPIQSDTFISTYNTSFNRTSTGNSNAIQYQGQRSGVDSFHLAQLPRAENSELEPLVNNRDGFSDEELRLVLSGQTNEVVDRKINREINRVYQFGGVDSIWNILEAEEKVLNERLESLNGTIDLYEDSEKLEWFLKEKQGVSLENRSEEYRAKFLGQFTGQLDDLRRSKQSVVNSINQLKELRNLSSENEIMSRIREALNVEPYESDYAKTLRRVLEELVNRWAYLKNRAIFNLAPDDEKPFQLLIDNCYLPIREAIEDNPELRNRYDQVLNEAVQHFDVYFADKEDEEKRPISFIGKREADDFTRYSVVARYCCEAFFNLGTDAVKEIFYPDGETRPTIIIVNNELYTEDEDKDGHHISNFNMTVVEADEVCKNDIKAWKIYTHEAGHDLDFSDRNMDGIPSGMSSIAGRDELFRLHNENNGADNLRDYAFKNEKEFLAVALESLHSVETLDKLRALSPDLYSAIVSRLNFGPVIEEMRQGQH